jgi:hypothetical protein
VEFTLLGGLIFKIRVVKLGMDIFLGVKNRLLTTQKYHSVVEIFLNHVNLLNAGYY